MTVAREEPEPDPYAVQAAQPLGMRLHLRVRCDLHSSTCRRHKWYSLTSQAGKQVTMDESCHLGGAEDVDEVAALDERRLPP